MRRSHKCSTQTTLCPGEENRLVQPSTMVEQQPNSKEDNLVIFYLLQSYLASDVRQI